MINQEEVYRWLSNSEYDKVINLLHGSKEDINSDALLNHAAKTSIAEIIRKYELLESATEENIYTLDRLNILHIGKFFCIEEDLHKRMLLILMRFTRKDLKKAYNYATYYPNEPLSQSIIKDYNETGASEVNHIQNEYIRVSHNNPVEDIDCRIPLFKSNEEQKMFLAFKRIFDTYQLYPNVALSNLIDFEKIKDGLIKKEQEYFFKSSVDLVVFEPFRQYQPIYFFELDSIWHDTEYAIENDQIKDKIFTIAGLKLIRIRGRQNQGIEELEFEALVKEVRAKIDLEKNI